MKNKCATLIAGIPYRYIAAIGRILGLLIYCVDVRHRRIVRQNLSFVYPEWTVEQVRKTSRHIFQNLGITLLEVCQMICFTGDEVEKKVTVSGEEHLAEALRHRRGVVLISAHIGNWELVPLFWPIYFKTPLAVVARALDNITVDRWVCRLRTRFGSRVMHKDVAMPEMIRTLRQNKALAVLIDQGTLKSQGVKITFFTKFVTVTSGVALLAMRCKSPVLPGFCIRNDDGTFSLNLGKPFFLKRTGDLDTDLKRNTQIMTDAIEEAVRKYPEQWFWVHKRWKRYYPHLYPEDMARRQARRIRKRRSL